MPIPTAENVHARIFELLADQYGIDIKYKFEGDEEFRIARSDAGRALLEQTEKELRTRSRKPKL